jgi:hypothetical protein
MTAKTQKRILGEDYLTSGGVADALAVSKSTVLAWCAPNKTGHALMRSVRLGYSIYIKPEWVEDFVRERTTIGIEKPRRKK